MWLSWLGLVHVVVLREVKESSQDIIVNVVSSMMSQTIYMSPLPERGELDSLLLKILKAKSTRVVLSVIMEFSHRFIELDGVKLRCVDKSSFRTVVTPLCSYFL